MSRETLASKLAQKAFESDAVQKSWHVHTQAFGPILEPAFVDNYKARIDLTAALNFISNRDCEKGLKKLQSIKTACITDQDKAAWWFCMGLCMEMSNRKEDMIASYQTAGLYKHSFYLPYLKIAKAVHNEAAFDIAKENYVKAIQYLNIGDLDEQKRMIIGSIYTNLASCLTMMHCYEEAEDALNKSKEFLPEQTGRSATEAILSAAEGDSKKAYCLVDILMTELPLFYENTKKMVDDILSKNQPQFNEIAMDQDAITDFWNWFVSHESILLSKLDAKEDDVFFQIMQPKLNELFPYMERDLDIGIEPGEELYTLTFADYYMVSLEHGYKELIEAMPESLIGKWKFDIAR